MNEIASLAKGRFLARMDADDIMHPRRIEIQLKTLRNNDFIDVLGSNAYTIDESNVVKGLRQSINLSNETLMEVKNFIHPTIMANVNGLFEMNIELMFSEDRMQSFGFAHMRLVNFIHW